MTEPVQPEQMYALKVVASGVVRDADGNILNDDVPVETTVNVTESQAREIIEGMQAE